MLRTNQLRELIESVKSKYEKEIIEKMSGNTNDVYLNKEMFSLLCKRTETLEVELLDLKTFIQEGKETKEEIDTVLHDMDVKLTRRMNGLSGDIEELCDKFQQILNELKTKEGIK